MLKTVIFWILILLTAALSASWQDVNKANSERFSCNQMEQGTLEIVFQLDGYNLEEIFRDGKNYTRISHPEGRESFSAGMPDLPRFNTLIALPARGDVTVNYNTEISTRLADVLIFPAQDNENEFFVNSEYYSHGSLFPEEKVITANPAIMRDLRVMAVSVSPFSYNASTRELEIAEVVCIEVNVTGNGGINPKTRSGNISRAFEPLYKSRVLNYNELIGRPAYQQPTLVYVISDDDDALETLEYLKDWKRQKGFNVVIATTAETGSSNTQIKNWLQNAYDNWDNPPEYVCFCGDASGTYEIPAWGNGDHNYAVLEGNDLLEDVILGRLSFENINTFQVLVSKILNYEKEPYLDETEWYGKAVLAGDTSISGPSMRFTCQNVKEMMLDYPDSYNGDDNFIEIYGGSFPSSINNAINSGVSYMVYRGWLGMSGWSPGAQSNSYMLPFATLLTCGTGSWTYGTSDSEQFMRMGSLNNPTGAIGVVGMATAGTHSCFNNALTLGIYGSIFVDSLFTMGAATTGGKYYLYDTFPQDPGGYVTDYHEWANLMGEPSLELWTDLPEEMNVIYNANPAWGSSFLEVNVRDAANAPLKDAWVTLSNEAEDFFFTDFCSEAGNVMIDLAGAQEGEYDLVVTYHDFIPHLGNVEISQTDQYLDIQSINYDDAAGNGDGILNPGESVIIYPTLMNYGTDAVNDISVNCNLVHNYLNLTSTMLEYDDLAAGASSEPLAGLGLEINPAALGGMQALLELNISDGSGNNWTTWHYLNIEGVNLYATEYEVVGADLLEPGEPAEIYFTLENLGSITTQELEIELFCQNPRLIISDSLGIIAPLAPGASGDNSANTFQVTPSITIIPGTQLTVEIHASSASGYYQVCPFVISVGTVEVTDPLGPCDYGYWVYDDGDLGYDNCPEFDWIEIDPDLGGAGAIIPLSDSGDNGDLEVIDIPDDFNLSFYGVQYTELTVCSNGWIAPGAHESANFMNHPLPGPEGPNPMIAVFWDDLSVSGGNVCWFFDDVDYIFIVEWSDISNGDTGSPETFQVIIYDPDYYQTMTNDCLIKMQYLIVNNNNAGSYPSNHGQFCTVGLESENALAGLTYTFNDTYPASCKELENEMAVLFSPPQYPEFGPYLEMVAYDYLAGDDEFIEAGESVTLSVTLGNQGAEEAAGVSVEMIINDPWFSVIDGNAFIDYVEPVGIVELLDEFCFEVSEQVPDNYPFDVTINMSTEDDFWHSSFSLTAHWINAFQVDADSIDVTLGLNLTTQRSFTLTNTSSQTVNYYLRMDDEQTGSRDISGSYVVCEESVFYPGTEMLWQFTVLNNSSSNEWVTDVWLDFPPGVNVISATNGYGGSGGTMEWDGTTGDGAVVNWHGETANGWGVLHNGEMASWNVNVAIGENFASDIQVGYEIQGDGYGAEPHNVYGDINFNYPIQWISLNTSFGTLPSGESDEIIIYYDTQDMEIGDYHCTINILSDSWFAEQVHTHLSVVAVNQTPDDLPQVTRLSGNFPNPFNPSTRIQFSLAESGFVLLDVYNARGQKVSSLIQNYLEAGLHLITWNGKNDAGNQLASGVYYLKLKTGNYNKTHKILMIK